MESIIENLGLNNKQVLEIVLEWYSNGLNSGILQNEHGQDLEEIIEKELLTEN
tara:strand:+ start:6604 stop:6762 length:159 start_codon:yes stop_codon:yes gene_type:complete